MDECRGDALIFMDADLQDPPEVIAKFVSQWKAGYEIVYAVRKKRKENFLKRACYKVFYRSLQIVANIDVPLDAGDFCLMDRCVVDALMASPERNRFLRGLRSWVGFSKWAWNTSVRRGLPEPPNTHSENCWVGLVRLHRLFGDAAACGFGFGSAFRVGRTRVDRLGSTAEADKSLHSMGLGIDGVNHVVYGWHAVGCARHHWRILKSNI